VVERRRVRLGRARALAIAVLLAISAPAAHASSAPAARGTAAAQPEPAGGETHDAEGAEAEEHGMLSGLIWPIANFVVLVGALWYFLRKPIATHFTDRHAAIRKDLDEAAGLRAAANEQLAEIERKLKALPGEIAALGTRGAEEIAAEEQRISTAAAAERDRLLEEMRREIDLQVRLARREILEHAADLAVQLAGERLQKEITPADHARIVDQYLGQVRTAGDGASSRSKPRS
jgi:F-type H+-transporting ATPase subunit b